MKPAAELLAHPARSGVVILLLALVFGNPVACDNVPTAPDREPLIEGTITRMGIGIASARALTILVEEDPEDPVLGETDKVFFFLDVFTPVRLAVGTTSPRMVGIEGLDVGQRVRVWAKGVILQSDPAQTGTAFIEIICENAVSCPAPGG